MKGDGAPLRRELRKDVEGVALVKVSLDLFNCRHSVDESCAQAVGLGARSSIRCGDVENLQPLFSWTAHGHLDFILEIWSRQ